MTQNTKDSFQAETVLAGLKDFQRRTVDHVFDRLYAPGSSGRYLVADEVGLGKTLVARGVIARAIEHLRDKVERIDVLYICSNGDIARQNIQRLKLDDNEHVAIASRLTLLPLHVGKLKSTKTGVNFISFTPTTSFDLRDGLGQSQERVLLYWMLRKAWGLGDSVAPMNALRGNVGVDKFRSEIASFDVTAIDADAQASFVKTLERNIATAQAAGDPTLRTQFDDLRTAYGASNRNVSQDVSRQRSRWVGALRSVLAASCVEPLEPDLVILDEFQRFSHLLDDQSDDANALARAVFEYPGVRVLMLSATPYKMYTVADEASGEDHYKDFVRTVRFLEGKTSGKPSVEHELESYRSALLGLTDGEGPERLRASRTVLEARLRNVMVRTERLASTPDRNGMLKEVVSAPMALTSSDALDYVALQSVARELKHPNALEYWKSTPYALSFLDDNYKLKTDFRDSLATGASRLSMAKALSASSTATLPWEAVQAYQEIDPGNPRMRALVADMLDNGAHKLLWMPPSMPYYRLQGAFAARGVSTLTKRLVFSSWRVVPRAIAAVLSYEVERRLMGVDPEAKNTPEYRGARRGLLRFGEVDGRLTGMPVLALLYPSLYLAEACDPVKLATELLLDKTDAERMKVADISAEEVLAVAREHIQLSVDRHLPPSKEDAPVDERWYWAAPLLLDHKLRPMTTVAWFQQKNLAAAWTGQDDKKEDDDSERRDEQQHWHAHVNAARDVALAGLEAIALTQGATSLGKMPDDLVDVLAQLAVAGPAVTMFRAMLHVVGGEGSLDEQARTSLRNGAGATAWAFRSLFNQPEVMALVRGPRSERDALPYWRQVLAYCVDGGLQAVLDEYVHVLRDHLGLMAGTVGQRVTELADEMIDAIDLRSSRVGVDDIVRSEGGRTIRSESHNMRTHFALRFGDERSDDGQVATRADQVRKAFNSPFWPFVVATTSVGQEGLDFHTYCHAVVHWNLPSNPVDFEQREGRVHRYKGHAVRKNVAQIHGEEALHEDARDRWQTVFSLAKQARPEGASDIIPFWVHTEGDARIERHMLSLPLSRERSRAHMLRKSLAIYRMVFGQPRQEELVAYLLKRLSSLEEAWMKELCIDLSPNSVEDDLELPPP